MRINLAANTHARERRRKTERERVEEIQDVQTTHGGVVFSFNLASPTAYFRFAKKRNLKLAPT